MTKPTKHDEQAQDEMIEKMRKASAGRIVSEAVYSGAHGVVFITGKGQFDIGPMVLAFPVAYLLQVAAMLTANVAVPIFANTPAAPLDVSVIDAKRSIAAVKD